MVLTRRSLVAAFGVGAGSAVAGAMIDHALNLRGQAQAADRDRQLSADALRLQGQRDAEIAAQAMRQSAFAAQQDKAMAVAEVKAQLPDGHDHTISTGFEHLGRTRPWLGELRRSVGYFECAADGITYRGAAELLDDQGTLVLCGHEFVGAQKGLAALSVTFFTDADHALRLPIRMRYVDRAHDVAFATVEQAPGLPALGLKPVAWADAAPPPRTDADQVVFVGFPEGIARVHATSGAIRGLRRVDTQNGDGSLSSHDCKIETGGVTFSGMSGGGVFRQGAFAGIVNFSSPAGAQPFTYFTPAAAIRRAYAELFPARARAAGLSRPLPGEPRNPLPAECAFGRSGFMTVAER